MALSSKGRASSRNQTSAGKTRVISTKRKDALPRTGTVSAGPPTPVVLPPIDALTEPLATAVAAPKKKARRVHQKDAPAGRKKTTRAAGRASAKLDEPAAMEVAPAVAPVPEIVEVAAPAPALEAPEVEALAVVETELEVEASAIVEELLVEEPLVEAVTARRVAIGPPPIPPETRRMPLPRTTAAHPAPAPRRERLLPAVSRLLSMLCRWTGVSGRN